MSVSTPSRRKSAGRPLIMELRQVVKVYSGAGGDVLALNGIDLEIREGELLVVSGRSGSGKTTLINCVTGLDRCTSGKITVAGTRVDQLGTEQAARWRRRNVGVVFQAFELLPTLTALENVMLPMDFAGAYSLRVQRQRAFELLDLVDIAEHARKVPAALSGGQQQRLAIARAMANDPRLLAADEPTGSLDSVTAGAVLDVFEALVARGTTVLMVSHDRDVAARGTRTVMLSDGGILPAGDKGILHA